MIQKQIIEAYSQIDEKARITGVALIPRISRNQNLYTKKELARFDNVTVPLNWEHDSKKRIGTVTFHYNKELETVYYEGMIEDESSANLARNKTLFTSIEADPISMKEICNAPDDCFHMPFGLVPVGMALTETPGIPETTVKVIEHYIKECTADLDLESKYVPEQKNLLNEKHLQDLLEGDNCVSNKIQKIAQDHPEWKQDQRVAVAISYCKESEIKDFVLNDIFKVNEYCAHCGEEKKKIILPKHLQSDLLL